MIMKFDLRFISLFIPSDVLHTQAQEQEKIKNNLTNNNLV